MSKNDTTFQAKSPEEQRKGLDGTEPIKSRFNADPALGDKIANASPEAQATISQLYKIEEGTLVTEERNQARSHEFRVLKQKDKLMQKFFSEPSPMPNDPQAKAMAYQTIADQAERMVTEREQYFRDNIKNQTDRTVREVIRMDEQGMLPSQNLSHEKDQEHERDGH